MSLGASLLLTSLCTTANITVHVNESETEAVGGGYPLLHMLPDPRATIHGQAACRLLAAAVMETALPALQTVLRPC